MRDHTVKTAITDSKLLFHIMRGATLTNKEVTKDGKLKVDAIIVKGIGKGYAFHPERLKNYRRKVMGIIAKMDERFFKGNNGNQNGGLVVLMKKNILGEMWTEGDIDLEHLICLSIGLGLGDFCQKREEWLEMPYFVFHCSRAQCESTN